MSEDNRKIAESVRSGHYFEQAREWFQALYIGPISERSFFLVIAVLSALTAVFAGVAVLRMMPLTSKVAVIVYAPEDYEGKVQKLVSMGEPGDDINESIVRQLASSYVAAREGYSARTMMTNGLMVYAHSSPSVYAGYQPSADPQNPESYYAKLGQAVSRVVDIKSVKATASETGVARVDFSVEYKGVEDNQESRWTAKLNYSYTGVKTETVKDEETGQQVLQATEPTFQVTSYELEQR
jgi:type IV secretory pathway component VirB8